MPLLVVRGGRELGDPDVPRVELRDQPLDRPALARGVPPLEQHAQRRSELLRADLAAQQQPQVHQSLLRRLELPLPVLLGQAQRQIDVVQPAHEPSLAALAPARVRSSRGSLVRGHGSGTMDDAMTALPLVFDAPRRGMPPRHLADLTREEARAAVAELGQPAFRADQLARHFYRGVTDPAQMTDVPAAAREALAEALLPGLLTVVRHQTADNGRTRKTLWRLHDGALVESVLMRYPDRATVCISSQAGCGMACPFCATGQGGLPATCRPPRSSARRSPPPPRWPNGELDGGPGRLSNVVFMGMGEPLANYARVRKTLDALLDAGPARPGALPARRSPSPPSAWCRRSAGSPRRAATSPSR